MKTVHVAVKAPTGTLDAFKKELKHVMDDMVGEVGARKRHNVKQKQTQLAKSWAEGGHSRNMLASFCTRYGL